MKIIQLITKKQRRGAEIFASQLAQQLRCKGHEVHLVYLFEGEGDLPFSGSIHSLEASKSRRFWDWQAWRNLNALIQKIEPDIIQVNASDTLKYAAISKKVFGWKVPLIYRNANQLSLFIRSGFQLRFNRWLMQEVTGVASVSEICRDDFQQLFSVNPVTCIPIGVDTREMDNGRSAELIPNLPDRYILFAGGLVPEKDPLRLLSMIQKLAEKSPDLSLVILGSGPLGSTLEKAIIQKGLSGKVYLISALSHIFPILRGAEALVLPSKIEGLPAVILEAFYSKIPVIAYGVGGIPEVLKTKETGWCIAPGNENDFLTAIEQVLSMDTVHKEQILANAHQLVKSKFSIDKIADQFEDFYFQFQR